MTNLDQKPWPKPPLDDGDLRRELEKIKAANSGRLDVFVIADAACDPASPLHGYGLWGSPAPGVFCWRDRRAAVQVGHVMLGIWLDENRHLCEPSE